LNNTGGCIDDGVNHPKKLQNASLTQPIKVASRAIARSTAFQ